jgi:hypothetical protein
MAELAQVNREVCFTGSFYQQMRGPMVYVWMRGGDWLYVGRSYSGVERVFASGHHRFNAHPMEDDDMIRVISCETKQEARELERQLIVEHKPKFNWTTRPKSGKPPNNAWTRRMTQYCQNLEREIYIGMAKTYAAMNHDLARDK